MSLSEYQATITQHDRGKSVKICRIMNVLRGKRFLLGVTGSVAAYKAAELARLLVGAGADVRVALTGAALHFITPATMQALSGHAVYTDDGNPLAGHGMDHVDLAEWSDVIVIAPASANHLARLAVGLADDLLTATVLASDAPLLVAPAMNRRMWEHSATRENMERLQRRGVRVVGPATGLQACGMDGLGRMVEPEKIMTAAYGLIGGGRLSGKTVVVTAGPTREPIDPVRYLSNRSSGHMGYALAGALAMEDAAVKLISGPVSLTPPSGVSYHRVLTAGEMCEKVLAEADSSDILIAAAAVADYRCVDIADQKIHKNKPLVLHMQRTVDILAEVGKLSHRPFLVGFAAETDDVEARARVKMRAKQLDMIIANQVGWDQGFGDVATQLKVLCSDESDTASLAGNKNDLACRLTGLIVERYHARCAS